MNEGKTTAIFGAVAAVALGMAWWANPESIGTEDSARVDRVRQDVFPDFQNTDAAASMQIVKYDAELAQLKRFEVARDKTSKLWKLPSNDDYPADAAEQVRDATTPLVGLKVLSIESFDKGDQELYGVVNPDEDLSPGMLGVGMLVRLKDESNTVLASLIIGKEVKQAEGLRYARIPTEDAVYTVEIDTAAFTTNFRDWIDSELLGIRTFDITKIGVRDYELHQQSLASMALQLNFNADAHYDTSESKWSLTNMHTFEGRDAVPAELDEGEEINTEFLNDLRSAVQDLEIRDVRRKPKGLAADLKADESLLQDQESIASLGQQGFFAAGGPDGTEIYAKGGETIIGTADGVDYVLRFGEATASLSSASSDDEDDSGGLSRYLLVTARLDESKFPLPELEALPETVEEMLALEKADKDDPIGAMDEALNIGEPDVGKPDSNDAKPPVESPEESPVEDPAEKSANDENAAPKTDEPVAEEPASAEPASEEPASEEPASEEPVEETADEPDSDESGCDPQEDDEASEEDAQETASDESIEDQTVADKTAATDDNSDANGTEPATQPATSQSDTPTEDNKSAETDEELQERLEALREKIAKENQRKIDERNEKMDKARKKVQELNARFSEWYYVVADSVYKKLKVTRDVLIKVAAEEKADAVDFSSGIPGLPEGFSLPAGIGNP